MNTPQLAGPADRQRGFSLQELLVGLAILGVLVGLAGPSLAAVVLDARRSAALHELLSGLYLARSESQKRGQAVAVCGSRDGQSCSRGWPGWLVFVDLNQNDRLDDGETVLRVAGLHPALHWASDRRTFSFRPFGRAADNGSLTLCDARGARQARALIVSPSGRPRLADRRADGSPLACG